MINSEANVHKYFTSSNKFHGTKETSYLILVGMMQSRFGTHVMIFALYRAPRLLCLMLEVTAILTALLPGAPLPRSVVRPKYQRRAPSNVAPCAMENISDPGDLEIICQARNGGKYREGIDYQISAAATDSWASDEVTGAD